jgi:ribonuclease HI
MNARRVEIWTDGGCNNKTGIGGWAAVILMRGQDKSIYVSPDGRRAYLEISGGMVNTTSNRMELTAAIKALRALTGSSNVILTTDSKYLKRGMTEWINGWKRYGWKTAAGTPVINQDLWQELNFLQSLHTIKWKWVPGHAGVTHNERCDELCTAEIAKLKANS